jgi:NHL repeat
VLVSCKLDVRVAGSSRSSTLRRCRRFSSPSKALFLSLVVAGIAACDDGGGGGDGDDGDDDGEVDAGVDAGGVDADGSPDGSVEQVPLIEGLATLAGVGVPGTVDGNRDAARFNNPVNLLAAEDGTLIVSDFDNDLIRRVNGAGDVTTISEPPLAGVFRRPFGLVMSGDSILIQTDGNSLGQTTQVSRAALWKMPLAGGPPELVRDNIGRCRGMVELPDGRIAMAFYQSYVLRLYNPSNNTLTDLAGTLDSPGYADGQGAAALFDQPYDIVLLADGALLVTDFANNRLRRVDLDGNVTTYAGTGVAGSDDGPLDSATFNQPQGLAQDAAGNIYVTDTGSYLIRRISPDGQVTTIAGDGSPGYLDNEDPRTGQLYGIEGLDVGTDGYLYVADGTRGETVPFHRVRRLTIE